MGKVFLRINTNNNDGIPTDAVSFVDGAGSADHTATGDDSKNPRVKVLTPSAEDYTHNGGTGFTADAIIILNEGSTTVGKIDAIRVLTRGSGYGTADGPSTAPPQVTFGSEIFTAVLGTGEPDAESVLIAENGGRVNTDTLFFVKKGDGKPDVGNDDFSALFGAGANEINASEFAIFNPYQKHIDYDDLKGFATNVITTAGAFATLSSIGEMRSQVTEANRKIVASNLQVDKFNLSLTQGYESERIAAEEAARQAFEDDLVNFQNTTGNDILQFSNNNPGSNAVDPVWQSIATTISNLLPFFQAIANMTGSPIPGINTNFSGNQDAINFYNSLDSTENSQRFFPSMGSPQYPSKPNFLSQNNSRVAMPKSFGAYEGIAKGFIYKALCFAGVAALGHLYELLNRSNNSSSETSVIKLNHSANCFAPKDTDGVFVEWFKTNCRQHDIIGGLKTMISGVISIFNSIVASLGDKNGILSDDARHIAALMAAAGSSSMVESLKSTYVLLGDWVDEARASPHWNSGRGAFTPDERAYIQKLDMIRGIIATKLDEIAYHYNAEKYVAKPQIFKITMAVGSKAGYAEGIGGEFNGLVHPNAPEDGTSRGSFEKEKNLARQTGSTVDPQSPHGQCERESIFSGGPLCEIYGNKTTGKQAQVELVFALNEAARSELIDIKILDPGFGFLYAPIVRLHPDVWMKLTGAAKTVIVESIGVTKGPDLSKIGLAKESQEPFNVAIAEMGAQAAFNKWTGIQDELVEFSKSLNRLFDTDLLSTKNLEGSSPMRKVSDLKLNPIRKSFHSVTDDSWEQAAAGRKRGLNSIAIRTNIIDKIAGKGVKGTDLSKNKLCAFDFFHFDIGKCDPVEITSMNDDLANTFFKDPQSYLLATAKQKISESICQKKACGVVHAYSEAPTVGEGDDALCGNSTVTYNMHPTAEWWFNSDSGGAGIIKEFLGSSDIKEDIRIGNAKPSWASFNAGAQGDSSLPPVFGNWVTAFDNDKNAAGFWGKLFRGLVRTITLGQYGFVFDPRVTVPINQPAKELLNNYNDLRLYPYKEFTEINSSSTVSVYDFLAEGDIKKDGHLAGHRIGAIAPTKPLQGGAFWAQEDSSNFIKNHQKNLKAAYQMVADKTGIYAWDELKEGALKIEPVLSKNLTFSGMCYPHVTQYDVAKKSYLIGTEYEPLGTWHPTANTEWQLEQEISIGRDTNNSADDGSAAHLPKGNMVQATRASSPVNTLPNATRKTLHKGFEANKEVYISKNAEWKSLSEKLHGSILHESEKWPLVHIEDISYHIEMTKSGIPAGAGDFLIGDLQSKSQEDLNKATMDVKGYVDQATTNRGLGYWDNDGTMEPFDSDNLKSNFSIPHSKDKNTKGGNSMISGAFSSTAGAAYTSAETQYTKYKKYINMFHYTGVAKYKEGTRFISEEETLGTYKNPWEKTAYHATSGPEATQLAWNQLAAVEGWNTAQTTLASDLSPLAVSGIKSGPDYETAVYNAAENTWSPIDPSLVGWTNYTINGGFSKGHNLTAANNALAIKKAALSIYSDDGCAWQTAQVSFSGSVTGRGTSKTIALTAAMTALNAYSETQYDLYGSGMNGDRISPVNTMGTDKYNFFNTGVTTWEDGSSVSPVALFDPYDSSSMNLGWTSRILYRALKCGCIPAEHVCESDMTASSCPEISASSSIHDLHDNCESTDCEVSVLEDGGLGVSTNWVTAVGDVRNSIYDAIRTRLVAQEYNNANNTSCNTHAAAGAVGSYSFSNIGTSLAVYPNFGALCNISDNYTDISWQDGNDVGTPPTWSTNGLRTASQADAAISHSDVGGFNIYQIINLKDWTAGTGDKDIYVMEEVDMINGTITDGKTECDGTVSGRNGDARRDLVRYGYRTAVFSPNDMSDLNGGWDGSSILGTTTTPLIAPVVITGSGDCPLYDTEIFKTVVTGRIDNSKAQCFIPLAGNEYKGRMIASGYVPTITGICDWSSKKRQIYWDKTSIDMGLVAPEDSAGWGSDLKKPYMSGTVDAKESYLVNYPKGISGLFSPKASITGAAKDAKEKKSKPHQTSITKNTDLNQQVSSLKISGINSLITVPGEKYSPVFLGGWPIKNQTNVDASKNFQEKSVFGKKVIVLQPADRRNAPEHWQGIKNKQAKILNRALFGKSKSKKAEEKESNIVILTSQKDFQEEIAKAKTAPNLANMKNGIIKITFKGSLGGILSYTKGGGKEINLDSSYLLGGSQHDESDGTYNYAYVEFELQAAACDQCMASPVGIGTSDNHVEADDEVVFYGENYRHMVQVDWELRSGGWAFEVPYLEPGVTVDQQGKPVTTQNWWDYITDDFMTASHGNAYTGHYAAWGMPFEGDTTQLNCTSNEKGENDQVSKYDKIFDFHLNFSQETASYTALKKNGGNEINFKKP
jgi:hypothetical protein